MLHNILSIGISEILAFFITSGLKGDNIMDLKGAEIRNILEMCMSIGTKTRVPLNVNVPYYQRPYRWDEKRITSLIEDFHKNKQENASAEYFVGSVVLVEDSNIPNRYDIIDGQQRVTTVFLLNYLLFLIQRSYVEEMISTKGSNLDGPLNDLNEIYSNLLGTRYTTVFSDMRNTIIEQMETLNDLGESQRDQVYSAIAELYRKTVFLPERDFTNLQRYYDEYEELQKNFILTDSLALSYSRKTFNSTLKDALAKVCIIVSKDDNPHLNIIGEGDLNANILQYTNAIKYEFNTIMRLVKLTGRPLQNTREILKYMKEIIENVRFCVIMTGNERDAYTLFEVLNDRAMEIDDLELIKNLFLKAYCNTSGDSDALIDINIGILDQIWGDEVFTRDLSDAHTKLISYLGTLYLTADESTFTNKIERYREIIESRYLSDYSLASNKYAFSKALNDIRIYQMLRIIIEEYKIPVRNAATACIAAENNSQASITYKTFHLLNALKLDGVLPALTNTIIRQFMNKMEANGIKEVNISDFKTYITEIRDDYQHNANNFEYRIIHELAFKLWKSALMSKDYVIPREIAKKGLQNIYAKKWYPTGVLIDITTQSKMLQQFQEWTQNWQYGKSVTADLKVKVLFINLFKTKIDSAETELTFDKAVYTFVTDKLQLDHMEARRPNPSNMAKHFLPADPHEPREKYIDSLGNMMILDSNNNNDKDNKPLAEAMPYYENMCSGHWLNELTSRLLQSYHNNVSIAGTNYMVPKEQFFTQRGSRLIHYFEKIVNRSLDSNKVAI